MNDTQKQPASVPESVRRLMAYAGKQRREVSNPCITANEAIEIANWMQAGCLLGAAIGATIKQEPPTC